MNVCPQTILDHKCEGQDIDVEKLKEMFPNLSNNQITEAMKGCRTIDECISSILDTKGHPAQRILQNLSHSVVKQDQPTYPITFNRSKSLRKIKEICRINKNAGSKLQRSPVVYFVSDSGDGVIEEDAADVGGPQREFFAIVMETLLSSSDPLLFGGSDGHKLPVHSQQMVLRGFSMVEQAMAHVITHTDFVIVGLAKPVVIYLETGCPESACTSVTMDDIPDLEIKEMLENLVKFDEKEEKVDHGNRNYK
ncbi:hypothetical protein AWC38_SpisGene20468 [Stylophora pistillata]|uniref:CUE domain-containing protein n=1 Tax=Stylophora pistillata TaxID=50429 RepID=A0A2B4RGB9_STYPI|nr:hypothetical protein AWC38_SpisGene20468 [Stylophora pistillata]